MGAGACQVLLEYAPPLERCGPRTGPYPHPVMGRPVERDRLRCYWNRNTVGEEFIEHRAMVGAEIQQVVVDRYTPSQLEIGIMLLCEWGYGASIAHTL